MLDCPDVLGFELNDILAGLTREGWQVTVTMTSPPGIKPSGPARVLRLIIAGERRVEIVAAHQGWGGESSRGAAADYG